MELRETPVVSSPFSGGFFQVWRFGIEELCLDVCEKGGSNIVSRRHKGSTSTCLWGASKVPRCLLREVVWRWSFEKKPKGTVRACIGLHLGKQGKRRARAKVVTFQPAGADSSAAGNPANAGPRVASYARS